MLVRLLNLLCFAPGVPADSLLKPAIEGTRTVLNSVVKHKASVKRVVLTSSFAGELLLLSWIRLMLSVFTACGFASIHIKVHCACVSR